MATILIEHEFGPAFYTLMGHNWWWTIFDKESLKRIPVKKKRGLSSPVVYRLRIAVCVF